MKRILTVLSVLVVVLLTGLIGAPRAMGALAEGLGLRDMLLGHVAGRLAAFRGDPVAAVMKGLETHLGLGPEQKAEITPLLTALRGKLQESGRGRMPLDAARLKKFQDGTLTVEDVLAAMKERRSRVEVREADVIDTVQAVYGKLDTTQRRIVANLLRQRIEKAREANPQLKLALAGRFLGVPESQQAQIWNIVQPCVDQIKTQALAAVDEFKDFPDKIEAGRLTTADLHQVVDRRKAIVTANQELIAKTVHQVVGVLTAEQRQQVITLMAKLAPAPATMADPNAPVPPMQ